MIFGSSGVSVENGLCMRPRGVMDLAGMVRVFVLPAPLLRRGSIEKLKSCYLLPRLAPPARRGGAQPPWLREQTATSPAGAWWFTQWWSWSAIFLQALQICRKLWGGAYEAARGGPGLLPVAAAGGGCFQWLGSKARHCWNSTRCSKGPLRCRSIGPVGWLVSLEAQLVTTNLPACSLGASRIPAGRVGRSPAGCRSAMLTNSCTSLDASSSVSVSTLLLDPLEGPGVVG